MKIICALILLCSSSVLLADTFDSLLESVKRQTRQELIQEDERVKKFVREKNNQQKLLKGAQAELATLKKQSKKLNGEIDANDKNLAKAELQLKRKTGDLGELFGVVRQVSGELSADFKRSMVSLQYPNRIETLNKLSQSRTLPDVDALERLWFLMLQEMG